MSLTSVGFAFLILPFVLMTYYICPNKFKQLLLTCFSVFFLYSAQGVPLYLFLLIFIDVITVFAIKKANLNPNKMNTALVFCLVKDIAFIFLFGISGWIMQMPKVSGICVVVLLFCCYCLSDIIRGKIRNVSSFDFLGYVVFFPKLFVGPFLSFNEMKRDNKVFRPSLTVMTRGIMHFTWGLAKRVVIANQLESLLTTLTKHFFAGSSILLGWLLVFIAAMRIYFIVSAYGDMARGISQMMSLKMPKASYYPFHSPSVRDYIYRFNMTLETLVGNVLFSKFDRESELKKGYLVSIVSVFMLSFILSGEGVSFWWGIYMAVILIPDYFFIRRIFKKSAIISRIVTFFITLPAFSFCVIANTNQQFYVLKVITAIKRVPFIEKNMAYLSASNVILLILSALFCLSVAESIGRFLRKQIPSVWWAVSALTTLGILILTVSFMLMRVV